ncbi:MAG: F420-0--gamma-glutamyl ligase [Clostridiales bacterium]|nr:F420-0--gamma-glutamyl ligase [Clostridiales bacterium]
MRSIGTVVRGIRTPIIKANDDLANIVVDSLLQAKEEEKFEFRDKDIVAITEAVVAIAENNYATVDDIAQDIKAKFPSGNIGLLNPILSRNRFSLLLKGMARGAKHITIQLSFPSDEVGNGILNEDYLEQNNLDLSSIISEKQYDEIFSDYIHPFTGINMVEFYRELVKKEGCEVTFVFSNNPKTILEYSKDVLVASIHTREKNKKLLRNSGANIVLGLDDILNKSINGCGYNSKYGLLGTNKATEEKIKFFPEHGDILVQKIQEKLNSITGKNIEVMVYGDGCFKDSVGGIWELADPVVSPAYTSGLEGTPNELKLKYLSDNKFSDLKDDELKQAIIEEIKGKAKDLKGTMQTQGTTPRKLTDLIGSLCDLTSGSGDKGTPVVFIQGYFDNLASE